MNKAQNEPDISLSKIPQVTPVEVEQRFEEKMEEIEIKEKENEAKVLAQSLGFPYITLKRVPIIPETLALIDEQEAKDSKVVCFYTGENDVRIGAVNPLSSRTKKIFEEITAKLHSRGEIYVISEESMISALKLYAALPRARKFFLGVEITEEDFRKYQQKIHSLRELNDTIQKASLTDMLTIVIAGAITARASDIHIETEEKDIKVRYRIDGILQDVAAINKEIWPKIISRVKLLSKLKLNITERPQDGRFTIFLTHEKIDVRVSTLPTTYGESVVMRLLMSSAVGLAFESLGLRGQAYGKLLQEIQKPNGMILTTGPTGSGKTTTLYAIITKLNNPGTKIITIEEPVEYRIEGINQSQVDRFKGYDFSSGLRSILRQDPDIVMVGEIRDLETADIALNAALTGHLVLTTLHTNDASGTMPRLLAMGAKSFLLAPAMNAMIGQRLVRKICEHCRAEAKPDSKTLSRIQRILFSIKDFTGYKADVKKVEQWKLYKGKGCDTCQGLGFKGRIGIFEIMTMNSEVENLIMSGHVSEYDMRRVSEKHGMITMLQDGILKVLEGITSLDEVLRVAKDTMYAEEI